MFQKFVKLVLFLSICSAVGVFGASGYLAFSLQYPYVPAERIEFVMYLLIMVLSLILVGAMSLTYIVGFGFLEATKNLE